MNLSEMYQEMGIDQDVYAYGQKITEDLKERFAEIDETAEYNQLKVLHAMQKNRVSDIHFAATSGYGYNDLGRDTLESVYADTFHAEAGLVRPQITCGTHALAIALAANLRPGDELLAVSGKPYDTLEGIIGIDGRGAGDGNLADYGIKYRQTELGEGSKIDLERVKSVLCEDKSIKVVFVQRSKGYQDRRTLSASEIDELYALVKSVSDAYVFVDNNYGEFCEPTEPKADLLCGSLIKNAGGGMAECGGYIVGSSRAVELASYRLTVPGIGLEAGPSAGQNKSLIKGLFYAPHTVAQALKSAVFAASLFERLGFDVYPKASEPRYDIIQMMYLNKREHLIRFCQAIQRYSPVDSFALPMPDAMPGYADEVIMAAGTFTQGSSIELSADAPLREPYSVYMQGGITYESAKYTLIRAAGEVLDGD